MQITHQTIHRRDWMKCPGCDGERKPGWLCDYCGNTGEVPRRPKPKQNLWLGYSSRNESRGGN